MSNKAFRLHYHLMLLPGIILLLIFSIVPMVGAVIAFQNFMPNRGFFGSPWVGLDQFRLIFQLPDSKQVIFNTVWISVLKIVFHFIVQVSFAVVLNEIISKRIKRGIQTAVYLPHFVSWVIMAEVVRFMLSTEGLVNQTLGFFQIGPVPFLASNDWFRTILVGTDVWKDFGFGAIIYLAAITGINPNLYEACVIDGGSRMQQIRHITLPGLKATMILMLTLSLGSILNAGFDQIFNMYNAVVYETGDIIDTYVYRTGLLSFNYSFATAVGLFKSLISFLLIILSYSLAYRFSGYRLF